MIDIVERSTYRRIVPGQTTILRTGRTAGREEFVG